MRRILSVLTVVVLLSACSMQWAGFNGGLSTLGSRDATRLSASAVEKDKVLAEIAQDKDVARLDAALADVLAQADHRASEQRTQWADFIPSMTFEQKLHVLDVLANERLSVLASDADAPRR
ncbi:MAG: hypothetical protein ABIR53_04735 [Paraperlucidibaca sp.]